MQHLADYMIVFEIEVESDLTQRWSIQIRGAAYTIIRMQNLES